MSGKAVDRQSELITPAPLSSISPNTLPDSFDIIAVAHQIIPPLSPSLRPASHHTRRHRNTCFGFHAYPTDHAAADDHRRSQRPPPAALHNRRTLIPHIRPLPHKGPRSHPGRSRLLRCRWLYRPGQRPRGTLYPSPTPPWMKTNRQDPLLGLRRRCGPYQVA